ncbi:hypothetical protein DACRYDRAFT_23606 [Dacryopinax primogenitus]|uniref:Uncharacterized protein n=1 Tax=Dacryopinax primogenitus (strain DJM 731) TaxID=1858805 RepID=M5FWR5_DACPD|nr:uncharacterized protein DACRYDRAFT_23606 [Dacryopinax primogenitus]EJU00130.1 hypothetical protein DACRYDRAFT_23606 [Dacryopinax primogenitus]
MAYVGPIYTVLWHLEVTRRDWGILTYYGALWGRNNTLTSQFASHQYSACTTSSYSQTNQAAEARGGAAAPLSPSPRSSGLRPRRTPCGCFRPLLGPYDTLGCDRPLSVQLPRTPVLYLVALSVH